METKSSLFTDDLRDKESAKIDCGKAHFQRWQLARIRRDTWLRGQ